MQRDADRLMGTEIKQNKESEKVLCGSVLVSRCALCCGGGLCAGLLNVMVQMSRHAKPVALSACTVRNCSGVGFVSVFIASRNVSYNVQAHLITSDFVRNSLCW